MATKITDEGHVAIPRWVQDQVGGPGSEVAFRRAADGTIILEKAETASALQPSGLDQLVGDAGPGMSTDEIRAMTRGDANVEAGQLHPDRFAEAIGSAGPGPSTDELMALLRDEPG